ncbi:MAG TPA: hypothetical protein VMF67_07845 [Rhizomicrobium sp.]|nr:hypothetical protein [Rhizomicrobium sp.]
MAARIDATVCEKLLTAATAHCATPQTASATPHILTVHEPNWEGVTNGLTALSADLAFGAVLLGLLTLIAGVGWGIYVKFWAEREARKEAKSAAKEWLDQNAAGLVSQYLDLLHPVPTGAAPVSSGAETTTDTLGSSA